MTELILVPTYALVEIVSFTGEISLRRSLTKLRNTFN